MILYGASRFEIREIEEKFAIQVREAGEPRVALASSPELVYTEPPRGNETSVVVCI
jgi:hypothetical protein